MKPTYLLCTLAILGGVNLVCAFVRAYKEMPRQPRFWPSIFLGTWATLILLTGGA
jgi:uncharacterized BrkB/YihY/UPF0761 family membrane protein